jgi:hypothetical protein
VYQLRKNESPFYREARFYCVQEVVSSMENAGFGEFASVQTICDDLEGLQNPEPIRPGSGEGSFVVLRGTK